MKKFILMYIALMVVSNYSWAGTWTILDYPGATDTHIYGISGNNLIGDYSDADGGHSFAYNRLSQTWTTFESFAANAIDGDNIVGGLPGWNGSAPTLYNSSTHTYKALLMGAMPRGISGNTVVATYQSYSTPLPVGYIFNIDTNDFALLSMPGAVSTYFCGVSGNRIVGYYDDGQGYLGYIHGLLYDGTTWTTLDMPDVIHTEIYAIDGSNFVGIYHDITTGRVRGFVYNGRTWTALDAPDSLTTLNGYTRICDIEGNNLVGSYADSSGHSHGFFYTIDVLPDVVCTSPVVGDLNGDCKVDFGDFAVMALHWLDCHLDPPSACGQ